MKTDDVLSDYQIQFTRLKSGTHEFKFEVQQPFFEAFENTDVMDALVSVTVKLDKYPTWLNAQMHMQGTVGFSCDRCLETVNIPVESDYRVIYKLTDEPMDVNNEEVSLELVRPTEISVNISQPVYETLMLSVPMIKNCDNLEVKPCNEEMLKRLENLEQGESIDESNTGDPRWEKLKELIEKNKK